MDWLSELRRSVRLLSKSPGYTTAVILTLALVIGANSAIFSAVHAVLLNPLPISQPDRLVVCWGVNESRNLPVVELSYRNFQDWAAQTRSFSKIAAVGSTAWSVVLERRDSPVRLASVAVSGSFFGTLGVAPALGRTLTPDDDQPNAARVVVLSHGLWTRHFGADAAVIGRVIQLDSPATVVGVMPKEFDYPRGTDLWLPVAPSLVRASRPNVDAFRDIGVLLVIGRLRDGVTPTMSAEELHELSNRLDREGAAPRFFTSVVVTPLLDHFLGPVRQALWALFGAVGVLLLIGCANVSGLMLTRVSLRHQEHRVRLALGATGSRLGRLWALEALILAAVGGVVGFMVSDWLVRAIVVLAPGDVPGLENVAVNAPVAAFTFAVVAMAALCCAIAPFRQARAMTLVQGLHGVALSNGVGTPHRVRTVLTTIQIGLAFVLLVSAGLVFRSFVNLRQLNLGFDPSSVLTMNIEPRIETSRNEWLANLLARVEMVPGLEGSGAVSLRPLALGPIGSDALVILEGQPAVAESTRLNPPVNHQVATTGYFGAMRIPLRRGRLFDIGDTARSPRVVLVSERAASRLWPGQNPVGKRLLLPSETADSPETWRTVVGVVGDVRYRGLDDIRLDLYEAATQSQTPALQLVFRTTQEPFTLAGTIQSEARRLDSRAIIDGVTKMEAVIAREVAPWRFSVWMFSLFAVLAFVLATLGLFSVVSLDVANRRREFAVRVALGARSRDVTRSVMMKAGRYVLWGLGVGILMAAAGTRAVQRMLFDVAVFDLATYGLVMGLLAAVVLSAAYLPARRAASADPLTVLRRE
jgi:predicted permease